MQIGWPKGLNAVVEGLKGYGATPLVAIAVAFFAFTALVLKAPALPVLVLATILIAVVAFMEERGQRLRIEEKKLDFDLLQRTKYPELSDELKRHKTAIETKRVMLARRESTE